MPVAPLRRPLARAAGCVLACAFALGAGGAEARSPKRVPPPAEAPAAAEPAKPGVTWTSGEAPLLCSTGRRKMWQDGEGWIVRRVKICR
ncbi:hypothetical protein MMB17_03645 [Methylobacterium organophilum]|uniref:hypothetical protein n=1 Tax=Methylobacterium organophilum TaxID=410 RepID=UPI001F145109|nr:hypothetical protein [Methylobacterium organophilum]UMY18444.1 hypothetical protein MMB17_03645 [Methylobacterium organophilum]